MYLLIHDQTLMILKKLSGILLQSVSLNKLCETYHTAATVPTFLRTNLTHQVTERRLTEKLNKNIFD